MKITCISDLHGNKPVLPGGDVLIIAGDCTARDRIFQWQEFGFWLNAQKYQHKIWIAGNHDKMLQGNIGYARELCSGAVYLQDSGIEIDGVKIWGTPWTRWFVGVNPDCDAFMLRTEFELQDRFDQIPEDIDILVTHGPRYGRLDRTIYRDDSGSVALLNRVDFLRTKQLRYHIHGHIHEAYGVHEEGGLTTLNVSRMDRAYRPVNGIVNIEIPRKEKV